MAIDVNDINHSWDNMFFDILWEYIIIIKSSINYSSFQLIYDIESKLPIYFDLKIFKTIHIQFKIVQCEIARRSMREQLIELDDIKLFVMIYMENIQTSQKKYNDKWIKRQMKYFHVGNKTIWLDIIG